MAELALAGIDHNETQRLVRSGCLVRIRRGVYADARLVVDAPAVQRHVVTVRAVLRLYPGWAVSHMSALCAWGLPVLDADVGQVHLSAIGDGRARDAGRAALP